MSAAGSRHAFVTLISSDSYLPGALAQVAALKDLHGQDRTSTLVCLVTPESVDVSTIKVLRKTFDLVVGVEILEDNDDAGLKLLGRLDLTTVLTKLHVFRLTQFDKIIFLDADVLPLKPLDHLFQLPHEFSAAPDVGWPDIFNSGVLVLSPGEDKFNQLNDLLKAKGSWDGGDQGLLNEWRGSDWHRLSFTYNTTPTAAYTYAPAYKRFGSEISAIHFIGKNKPWNSIAYRAPFFTKSTPASDPSQQTYDYDSLVDRWYAVYDKHYRSEPVGAPQLNFQKYSSVWNDPTQKTGNQRSDAMALDELKRLAIEGLAGSSILSRGEGQYISMPIEGRVDLMRPRKPETQEPISVPEGQSQETPSDFEEQPATPRNQSPLHFDAQYRWRTLPTPRSDEQPPSPQPDPISLPLTPVPIRFEPVRSDFYASESETDTQSVFLPELRDFGPSPHGTASPLQMAYARPSHGTRSGAHTPRRSRAASFSHGYQESQQVRNLSHLKRDDSEKRLHSPPLLSWNPALDPPPNDSPPHTFPSDTYFPNIWDHPLLVKAHAAAGEPPSTLFIPPPPPEIPEALIKQGHYRNVTGDGTSPDPTRVKTVFPWEERPRTQPRRIFPESDSLNPPPLAISPSSPSQTSTAAPSTPEQPKANTLSKGHHLSPLFGLPPSLSYANAWDTVPSITKYATQLVRPAQVHPLAPAFDDERWKRPRKTWDDKLEGGSRDGDDEGNADDEDDSDDNDDDVKWDDSDTESAEPPSKTPVRTRRVNKGERDYRDQAVQATPHIQEQAVQAGETVIAPKRLRQSSSKRLSTASGGNFLVPPSTRDAATSTGPTPSVSSASTAVLKRRGSTRSRAVSPVQTPNIRSPMRSPTREFIVPPNPDNFEDHHYPPVPQLSAPIRPSLRTSYPAGRSPNVSRHVSNDSSITSPGDSSGAQTPLADLPFGGPVRVGGRVWDPARGVEIFKRGSEEVLARFLQMGSWDN